MAKLMLSCPQCHAWNRVDAERAAQGPKCGKCAAALPLGAPWKLDDATFARTVAGCEVPVLVDFYADWCGPCKMMAPHVATLAQETVGRALVAKLDTDASPAAAAPFQIRGIPTTIVFRGGREVGRQVGAVGLVELRALLGA